jgi:transcriptional regulator with XRE-family HTH domain
MATNRSVSPNAEAVMNSRLQKAWRVEDLAGHARCSVRTVESVERGEKVYRFTMAKIAQALGVDYKTLLAEDAPAAVQRKRIVVQITVEIPYQDVDESGLTAFIESLQKGVRSFSNNMEVVNMVEGSTILFVEMDEADALALIMQVESGNLNYMGISEITLPRNAELGMKLWGASIKPRRLQDDLKGKSAEKDPSFQPGKTRNDGEEAV